MKNLNIISIATRIGTLCLLSMMLCSCKKFVDTPLPINQIPTSSVFVSDKNLIAALDGVYGTLANAFLGTYTYAPYFSDEIFNPNATTLSADAQQNTYNAEEDYGYFSNDYKVIYNANSILEALQQPSSQLTPSLVNQAKGECLFLRAFSYFDLLNFYGDTPLINSTNVNVNALMGRTPTAIVYQSMINDLKTAQGLLTDTYPTTFRWRVNAQVVNSLLAKVYLYTSDWKDAELAATTVINSPLYSMATDVNSVFLAGSNETLWQLYNLTGLNNLSLTYVPSVTTTVNYRVRDSLRLSFDPADKRLTSWIKNGTGPASVYYYPYKYKLRSAVTGNNAEYQIEFRLAELYLIRAEALAEENRISDGLNDVYVIRKRAGLPIALAISSQAQLLTLIYQERRKELMFENNNRWFDLKRSGQAQAVLSAIKPIFNMRSLLLPIPNTIIASNPNLGQNNGY